MLLGLIALNIGLEKVSNDIYLYIHVIICIFNGVANALYNEAEIMEIMIEIVIWVAFNCGCYMKPCSGGTCMFTYKRKEEKSKKR